MILFRFRINIFEACFFKSFYRNFDVFYSMLHQKIPVILSILFMCEN